MPPRRTRFFKNNSYYHLISQGAQEQRVFESEEDCRFFLTLLKNFKNRFLIKILGYCLMPDHVHLIVHCEVFHQLPRFMQDIHQRYTFYFNSKYKRPGKLWHGRFKTVPLITEREILNCMKDVEFLPVRSQLADSPSSYEWSGYLPRILGESEILDSLKLSGNVLDAIGVQT